MSRRGVTLVELLVATVISAIAFMALAVPFVAERSMWNTGRRQVEAQRDAQVVLRAIAREIREGSSYIAVANRLTVVVPGCGNTLVERRPDETLHFVSCRGAEAVLIDGRLSRAIEFVPDLGEVDGKLVRLRLVIAHRLRPDDPREETEILETEILLRNAQG